MFKYKATIFECQEKLSQYSLIICKNMLSDISDHGYEPQRKLPGIMPMLMQDNSTFNLQYTLFLKLGSH
ncbi:MAG: hypothetical protein CVU62_11940 [Deltaproteobacteria bacterium HGW-Deltaproteobacteria-2]|nr:MAG: hypothetical protein CVU62_11940 [Deltaproteobacteria bacterium HGW-Deltaproteobacteria-2]